jgi:glycosyltransferase involved in cell wall biosynthesis
MKFLLVASFPDSILSFRGAMIQSIQALGHEVHILSPVPKNNPHVFSPLEKSGCIIHTFDLDRKGMSVFRDLCVLLRISFLLCTIKPDILFSYTIKPVIYTGLISMVCPVVSRYCLITGLGYAFQNEKSRRTASQYLAQTLYRFALMGVTKVFFQNPDDQRLFRDKQILSNQTPSVVVNGSGVDIAGFRPCALPSKFSFLLIARLIKAKGILEFAEAAESILQNYEDVSFKVAGWTETGVDSIPDEVVAGWTKNRFVEFLGSIEDVRSAIADSSVYVLPSYREGTPRTVLEAMAMGRAIITTDVPGCKETVIDGHNGYLVPPKDVQALTLAIRRFLDNPSLATTMGKRSREIAVKKYDVKKVNKNILREMNLLASVERKEIRNFRECDGSKDVGNLSRQNEFNV